MIPPRKLALAAVVGAAYAALTVLLAPISFPAVQFRVSELLCILPFFFPCTAWGLFVGCAIANIFGGSVLDIVFGSLATLFAGLLTAWLGKRKYSWLSCILACLMPVLFNAVIVGAVITAATAAGPGALANPLDHPGLYAATAASVGFGELAVLFVLGLPLMRWLPTQ